MDYLNIYTQLCQRAKNREYSFKIYYESHHIIPRSMGGSDDSENRCFLTLKEHYLAHLILAYAGGPEFNDQWASVEAILRDTVNTRKPNRYQKLRYKRWVRRRIARYHADKKKQHILELRSLKL